MEVHGERIEAVTYVAEREGGYELPEIQLRWWNTQTGAVKVTSLAPVEVEVQPNPELAESLALPSGAGAGLGGRRHGGRRPG